MDKELRTFLDCHNILYEIDVDLKRKTWIHRGGVCECFISPNNKEQLLKIASFLYQRKIDFVLLGYTSNVYILNACNISVVVSTIKVNSYVYNDDLIYADCGVGVARLAKDMVENGVEGFEYLTDLPGTVGAAIYNNSSCQNNSISDLLLQVEVLLPNGKIVSLTPSELGFTYRSSVFKEKKLIGVILGATLRAVRTHRRDDLIYIAKINKTSRKQLLGYYSHSLGSTVNRCFINGPKPVRYFMPLKLYNLILRFLKVDTAARKRKNKEFICRISGFKDVAKYISNEDVIMFQWLDDSADDAFPRYLKFMEKVYKTNRIEIEVIDNHV